jgi:hypothetical protein
MKLSKCETCGQLLHFENSVCLRCGSPLGFIPEAMDLRALIAWQDGTVAPKARPDEHWRRCTNSELAGCNWLASSGAPEGFCPACRLNRTIPDLSVPGNLEKWRAIECAKRRLVYALLRLGLPLTGHKDDAERGLAFDFLADSEEEKVLTGHDDGLITINIAEADSPERERRRVELGEPYRTMLGHMRHEVGHYYWDMLVRDGGLIPASRAMFGDESEDYGEALERYYKTGAPADWEAGHVSAYATMHPWEDFAETWTHYLHMIDTLDTAASFGFAVDPQISDDPAFAASIGFDPYADCDIRRVIEAWLPLTVAVNSLNRSMGQPDLYPFMLSPAAITKLGFIHELVHGRVSAP